VADYINNVAAGDKYTDAATLGPDFQARNATITIANNAALMQFAVGVAGNWHWTDEREFFSIPQSFQVAGIIGVRVRNANPGQVARVLAVLSGPDDVEITSGQPFASSLSASGAITPGTLVVTGKVRGDGVVLAGTGFTCLRTAAGTYTITFATPFASPPVVFANMEGFNPADPAFATVDVILQNSCRVNVVNLGASADPTDFVFLAHEMV
jgi:hypothetical protein